jgi:hypothetical protein
MLSYLTPSLLAMSISQRGTDEETKETIRYIKSKSCVPLDEINLLSSDVTYLRIVDPYTGKQIVQTNVNDQSYKLFGPWHQILSFQVIQFQCEHDSNQLISMCNTNASMGGNSCILQNWIMKLNSDTVTCSCTPALVPNGQFTQHIRYYHVSNNYASEDITQMIHDHDQFIIKLINLKQFQSGPNQKNMESAQVLSSTPFMKLLPKCKNVNIKLNEWKHDGCKQQNQNSIYPCISTQYYRSGCSWGCRKPCWKPTILICTCIQMNDHSKYILAVAVYNDLFVAAHIWNAESNELIHSCILNDFLPEFQSNRIEHIHLIEQQSISSKSIIVVFEKSHKKLSDSTSLVHRYSLDEQCIQRTRLPTILKIKSEVQIGVILFKYAPL